MNRAAILLLLTLCACGDRPADAVRALQGAGYRDVETTGWRWLGCDEKDYFHTGFRAVGPTGTPVTGVVCASPIKGSTIRLD